MHIHSLLLENFRKFKTLNLAFNKGLNILIGENDSGKTAIIDAVKFILGTHSNDWLRLEKDDFHTTDGLTYANELKIICLFKDLDEEEAAIFLEWLSLKDGKYYLKLTLKAARKETANSISEISYDIKAGEDEESGSMSGEARNKLRATYLRPLRDAEYELAPRKGSRLSQILNNYDIFQKDSNKAEHELETIMKTANENIEEYFKSGKGKSISQKINEEYLGKDGFSLLHNILSSKFGITKQELGKILEKLELKGIAGGGGDLGLGSNNLLFIAAELLLLKGSNYVGLRLCLIEEMEAHLHPQAQINLVDFLNRKSDSLGMQSIITTHSNSLTSKVDLHNLIICKAGNAFSLRASETKLSGADYLFLERFLDDTKANLFFANGVIIVEGDAENLFLPALGKAIGLPLHKFGISIVNVGSTALLRYARIFQRENKSLMKIPVACITDRDIPPAEADGFTYEVTKKDGTVEIRDLIASEGRCENAYTTEKILEKVTTIKSKYEGGDVKVFLPLTWTLEYEIGKSCLRKHLHCAIQLALETANLETTMSHIQTKAVVARANREVENWVSSKLNDNLIAIKIFLPLVWDRTKASKAIVAQILSMMLSKSKIDKEKLLSDRYLKYLIDAIKYAANVKLE